MLYKKCSYGELGPVTLGSQVRRRGLWRRHLFHISHLWQFSHFIYIHCFPPSCGRIKQQFYSLGQLAHHWLHYKWNVDIKQDPVTIVITIARIYIVLDKVFLFSLECYLYYSYNFFGGTSITFSIINSL